MKQARSSRRMFLIGAGGAALTIPFLSSLTKKTVQAQNPTRLKYVIVASNFCADLVQALPFEADHLPLATVTQLDDATKRQALDEIVAKRGFITPAIRGAKWDRLRPYMNIIMGSAINGTNDKHNSCATTAASMPHDVEQNGLPGNDNPVFKYSADYLAERLLKTPAHAYGALRMNLAFRHGPDYGYIATEYQNYSFGGPRADKPGYADVLQPMRDVAELEQKLATSGTGGDDPAVARRKKLIDVVREDYRSVIASPRLSRADRDRLQAAIDLWNDAENRLRRGSSCAPPTLMPVSGTDRANWRVYHEYTMDLCCYALACEVTPVVSYALLHASDDSPDTYDEQFQIHGNAHTGNYGGLIGDAFTWRLERMAHFGNRLLDLKDETGAPLLDSTMLCWGHEYTFPGAHPNAGHWDLMLGKAGGHLDTGNYIDVMGEPTVKNFYSSYGDCVPYNRLLLTSLMAIGYSNQSLEAITGSIGFGEYGDVAGGTNDHRQSASSGWNNTNRARFYSDSEKRKPLPILKPI
jgi:hypothetical protein